MKKKKNQTARTMRPPAREQGRKRAAARASIRFAMPVVSGTQSNLQKIDHIIVLMLENRSFDHMIGYLKLSGRNDVDGLTSGMSNTYNGKTYPVYHLTHLSFGKGEDPCHEGRCVSDQISGGMAGFIANYAAHNKNDPYPEKVVGYYNGQDLPVFDYLAKEYCICDRWFGSVPGQTWPNRLYAATGKSNGKKDNLVVPIYNMASFVRHLDSAKAAWKWYHHGIPTLKLIDRKYVANAKNFDGFKEFLSDAQNGTLPSVSWIDPNFGIDFGTQNDDHPPADVTAGQELALDVFNAVVRGPLWNKSLLIVTYDEHGGLFDHVVPPQAQDDDPRFRSYGVRVPAFIVSPWVSQASVSHTVFDHTSIIKTILLRFCQKLDGSIPDMGTRVMKANDFASVLTLQMARPAPVQSDYLNIIQTVAQWRSARFMARLASPPSGPPQLSEFQSGLAQANRTIQKR